MTTKLFRKSFFFLIAFLCITGAMYAQTRTITGVVTSAAGVAQPGASVVVKGKANGAATDVNGKFSINVPAGAVTLVVSNVGFTPQEKTVAANVSEMNFSLAEAKGDLEAVVVTALGITRQKKTLVYATQSVKPTELIEARDANNVINSLSGKVANAVITQGSGGPGSGARIVLRGNRSIQGSNNALIVVDGVPINNNTNGTGTSDFGSVQGSDGASNINPDDIESVTVLRGASAAALYGSQAGNGVLVITTKKGKKDRLSVTLNSGIASESVFALPEFQNTYGQIIVNDTLRSGESWGPKMTGQNVINHLLQPSTYTPQPNNVRDLFRNGLSFNNSIGISGGNDKMQTYLSYTNNSIQGIIPKNDLMRHTVNLRITNQIGSRFSTDAKVTYVNQEIKNRPRTGEENAPVIDIYNLPRNMSTADAMNYAEMSNVGVLAPTPFPSTLSSIYQNPYWTLNQTSINEKRDRVIGFLNAKFKITDWLALSGRVNIDKTFDRGDNSIAQGTILWGKGGGDYLKNNITVTEKWMDVMLEGNNKISESFKVDYRVGAIIQDSKYDADFASAGGLNVTNKFSLNFGKALKLTSDFSEIQTQSVFGQTNFSFKDKIFLDLSIRNDWDSRLPSPHSFTYPSAGLSAILSDLLTLPHTLSFLKANINYAEVGNGGKFGLLKSVYNYGQGAGDGFLQRSATLPIPGLKPEIVKNLEFGIEARFLQNRIGFTATYYKSNSFNQLLQVNLPVATGYANKYINAGNIQNKGFEFVVNGSPLQNKNFKWDVTLNVAMNRSKVVELSDQIKIFYLGGGYGRSATPVVEEGKAYGDLIAYTWATDGKGKYVVDANTGKPVLTQDRQYIGNYNPKATVGFTNSFEYKGFSLRVLVDGRFGGTMVSGTEMNLAFSGIPKVTESFRDGNWSLGGVDANGSPVSKTIDAQGFWQIASGKRYGAGGFFAYDATNLRVREFSLGYNIPVKNIKVIKGAKLSFVARNLFWLYRGKSLLDIPGIGKRKMWFDPDMSLGNANFQGVEYGNLPGTRTIGANLQVTF